MDGKKFIVIFQLLALISCTQKEIEETNIVFDQLDPSRSNIDFSNQITENDTLNYFTFPFLYLGGGVSTGDINNDGLVDIYFTGNQVPNKLYLNKGNLQFEDITLSAGVAGDGRWYAGSTMVDINHDGWLDIYVSVAGKFGNTANQLFINQQDNTFKESAASFNIADKGVSIQSTFFDYDNDGLLDLFVANYPIVLVSAGNQYYKDKMEENKFEDSGHLYRNNGDGSFKDVTVSAGVQRFGLTLGLIAADFNNDGFKDLYLSNDFNVPDYFYQNNGDGTFSEILQQATRHTSMFGMGIDAADFNNDELLDLVQLDMTAEDHKRSKTNMASMQPATFYEAVDIGFHYQYMQNALQVNNGIDAQGYPVFSDLSHMAGMATTDWSWGVIFSDFNNDGLKDVFVTNGVKRDVNNNDVNQQYEAGNFWGRDENPDFRLMPSTPIPNYAFVNNGNLTFSNSTEDWKLDRAGFSNGFAVADLDNDGDQDIIINNIDDPASIFINGTQKTKNRYLKVKLQGPKYNPFGLGTKLYIKATESTQIQELTLTRGYQSSMDPIVHFGLDNAKVVNELKVIWPDQRQQVLQNIASNQLLTLSYSNAKDIESAAPNNFATKFTDITTKTNIGFKHQEDSYDDFAFEPLLPHRNSQLGPALAVGDVNNDGLEDIFLGNAAGQAGALYLQNPNGKFDILDGPWEADAQYEDTGALLFDADQDSDLDLYVVGGGNDKFQPNTYYEDRLYLNTESGFVKANQAIPRISSSGLVVVPADYDNDGDQDLFVGGRIVPGKYPSPAQSYILRNDGGKDDQLRFTNVTQNLAPSLAEAGLVTAAIWDDFDLDGKLDLILTGEWMPIRFFKNKGDAFQEVTEQLGFEGSTGWWYSLKGVDLDQDGDTDYLAGNLGLNYKYKASPSSPFEIFANDFDENSTTDIVLSYHKKGELLPLRGRECSSGQVPAIAVRFETYEAFAEADLPTLYGESMLESALHLQAKTFASCWIENKGGKSFEIHALPKAAQVSSINAIEAFDYNQDQYLDLLLFGNLYDAEVETPRNDAGVGLVLKGSGNGEFIPVPARESGILLQGEVKATSPIRWRQEQKPAFVIAKNNERPSLLLLNE